MSCNITAPTITNPFLHNVVIDKLQSAMASTGFMDEVYPLASVMEVEINGRRGNIPVIYGESIENPNNYIQMFADNSQRGLCFFELPQGQYNVDRGTEDGDLVNIIVRIIVTANLHNIANRTYDFTDDLIAGCLNQLDASELNQDINSISVITDKNRVFEKYTYTFNEQQSLAYPMTGFAIELGLTVNYDFTCVTPSTFDESFSPEC